MTVKITSTADTSGNVKALVYGKSGIGKTFLASTAPDPIILSAEAGLLSLKDYNIPVIVIGSMADLIDAYTFFKEDPEAKKYKTIALDSISEIAEVLLAENKKLHKDPRAAYGDTNDQVAHMIRGFRDLTDFHVYFVAKEGKSVDDASGLVSHFPSMPGKTLIANLPFFFDEVFCMRKGKTASGAMYRYLQTDQDLQYEAKDRSGKLKSVCKPDLSVIFDKILKKPVEASNEVIRTEEVTSDEIIEPEAATTIDNPLTNQGE